MKETGRECYKEAVKSGSSEYRYCTRHGIYPYLPVLDEILPPEKLLTGRNLGLVTIPAERIAGTKTKGRTEAFARNFMPLLDEKTEFGTKWIRLCDAHLDEGIHDPVIAYEYMNRYYIQEGNKRVSVLKYFSAVNIQAEVIRILPEETEETAPYYAFLRFSSYSGLNMIEFSKEEYYSKLSRAAGAAKGEKWPEEIRRKVSAAYYLFLRAYRSQIGRIEEVNEADVFYLLMEVFGFEQVCDMSTDQMARAVRRIRGDAELLQEDHPAEILTEDPKKEKDVFGRIAGILPGRKLKAAFLHDGTPEGSGWVFNHELGRVNAQHKMEEEVQTASFCNFLDGDPAAKIDSLVKEGYEVFFSTSPAIRKYCLRASAEYPAVIFYNCSLNNTHRNVYSYYARMYEAKFVIGTLAGALCSSGKVGYIADYPVFGQIAGINAFAAGIRMVNPGCRISLKWSSVSSIADAVKELRREGVNLISAQDTIKVGDEGSCGFGLSEFTEEGHRVLAMPVIHWDLYYEKLLKHSLNSFFRHTAVPNMKAVNYFWGMSEGIIDLYCTDALEDAQKQLAGFLVEGIRSGACAPLMKKKETLQSGPAAALAERLSMDEIVSMDTLADNIDGKIPAYEQLNEHGKKIVEVMGAQRIVRDMEV